ncbi:MAG: PilZ domain-containing protein, partial [Chloroflexi bacterium]|nr:PilZ domain-containing protein [Chloroflexota bacterium]
MEAARERPHRRASHRVRRSIPCEISLQGKRFPGDVLDISEHGVSVRLNNRLDVELGSRGSLVLGRGGPITFEGKFVHRWLPREGGTGIAVEFQDVGEADRRRLITLIYADPADRTPQERPISRPLRSFRNIAASLVRRRLEGAQPGNRKKNLGLGALPSKSQIAWVLGVAALWALPHMAPVREALTSGLLWIG